MKRPFLLLLALFSLATFAEAQTFSRADTLRGSLRPERTAYDVHFYDLDIKVDPTTKSIEGSNEIHFRTMADFKRLQVDLFQGMEIRTILFEGKELPYSREFGAVFIDFPRTVKQGENAFIRIEYGGKPQAAKNPPWDGGFVWRTDLNGAPWVGVACEGTGASLWWPCKDHPSDEPDSMRIATIVPDSLVSVSNGRLRGKTPAGAGWTKWEYYISYPINSYNVTVNIADYVHIHEDYVTVDGNFDLDYYVLPYNEEKARKQFVQVKPMMECYENLFGPYPFWNDGYKLVETAYLGMEHQTAIAYGNKYLPGYAGHDPLGLKFDYIVIHETGHEWWGNSVSASDHAELWIHESFCTYSEALYVECLWDYEKSVEYLVNQRRNVMNLDPMVGPLDVNFNHWASSDIYYKGAWMLHTIRNVVDDDAVWKKAIYDFAQKFRLKNTHTQEVIQFFNQATGKDLTAIFRQYLYHAAVPVFEYSLSGKKLKFRWKAQEEGFAMPIRVRTEVGKWEWITPTQEWQSIKVAVPDEAFEVDKSSFLVKTRNNS